MNKNKQYELCTKDASFKGEYKREARRAARRLSTEKKKKYFREAELAQVQRI